MRGSTGVSTWGSGPPPPAWKSTKMLIILILLVGKVQSYLCRVIIGPLAWRHLYDDRWRADGCPFYLLSVSVQVYCNEYGKKCVKLVIGSSD